MKFAKIGIVIISTTIILLLSSSTCKSEPISVDYYGDACECGKPVSYHVQIPASCNAGDRLINYGYKLKIPPPPPSSNDCIERHAFDVHVQEPKSRTCTSEIESHGFRILTPPRPPPCPSIAGGSINLEYQIRAQPKQKPTNEFKHLFTKVDKIVLKKPDCDHVVEGDCPCRKYKPHIDIVRSCTCHSNCGHFHETSPCFCGQEHHHSCCAQHRRRRDLQIEEYSLKGLMNDIFQVPRYIQQQKFNHQKQQELVLKQQLQQQHQHQQQQRRYQQNHQSQQQYLPRIQPPGFINDPLVEIEPISPNQLTGTMTTYVRPANNEILMAQSNNRNNINQQKKKLIFKLKPNIKEVTKNIKYKLDRFFTRHTQSNRIPEDRRVINKREIVQNDQASLSTATSPTTTSTTQSVSTDKIPIESKPTVGSKTNRILKNIEQTKLVEKFRQQQSKPEVYWSWDPVKLVSNKPSHYYNYYTPPQTIISEYQPTIRSSNPFCQNLRIQRHLPQQQYQQPRITTEESNFMIERNGNQYFEHVGRSSWPSLSDEEDAALETAYIVGAASPSDSSESLLHDNDDDHDSYGSPNRDYYYTQLEDILHRNEATTKDLNQVEPHQLLQEPISLLLQTIGFMKEITNPNSGKDYDNAFEYDIPYSYSDGGDNGIKDIY